MKGKIFRFRIIELLLVSLIFYAAVIPEYALGHEHPAHQIIAWKAWFLLPSSDVKTALATYLGSPSKPSNTNEDSGSYITEGTYDEDASDRACNHFWNTTTAIKDDPAINPGAGYDGVCYDFTPPYESAYRRAQTFWDDNVIPYYIGKDKNGNPHEVNIPLAFWWLGRVAHLLTDMSVPAHTHNDPHAHIVGYVGYNYETYINEKACSDDASCAWCPVSDIAQCGSPVVASDLYDLFWGMAEKADDYDSENREGEVDGGQIQPCLLWPDLRDGCYHNIGNVLIPAAIRHVAGLYQLFWAAKSISMVTTCDTLPMTIGDKKVGDIALTDCASTKYGPGRNADFYTFYGSAGDQISISIAPEFTSKLVLYDPHGLERKFESIRIPSERGYYTLPETGTYTLEVIAYYAGETGVYTLRSAKPGICRTAPMTIGGDSITSNIAPTIAPTPDDCVSLKYGINWNADFYTFYGSAGDQISISIAPEFTSKLVLYDPHGLERKFESIRIPSERGYYTLPETGTYTLEVIAYYAGETGVYTLSSLSSDTTAPIPGIVTPYNVSSGSFVDNPFDLKTTFMESESTITSCEYTTNGTNWSSGKVSGTKPNFTCTKTGINRTDGQLLILNMRAKSGGGARTATAVERTVDAQPPADGTLVLIPSNSQVKLNWSTAFDSRSGLRATNTYKVMRKTGTSPDSKCTNTNGSTQVHLGNSNSVVDSGLTNGTVYYYRVCAYDKVNNISTGATANAIPNWASKKLTNNAGNSINTSIAVDGESIYVAWQDDTPGNSEIYFRMSTDGGDTWAAARRLTNNTGNSANPAMAVNGTNIYVVWQNDTTGNPDVYDIYFRMSTDGGYTWTTAKNLASNAGNSANPAIAVNGLNVYVAWNDDTPGNPEIYFRESNDGGYTWAVAQPITSNAGNSLSPSIAVNGSNIYVAREDDTPGNYEIFTKKSTNGGTTWSTNKRLTNYLGDSANPSIAVNGSNVYVAWEDNSTGNYEIFVKRSTDGGNTWKQTKLSTNTGNSLNPSIAADGLNVYVVWDDDTPGNPEIYFRESNDGGATWAATENRSNNAGNSLNPSIAVDGNPYVVWSDDTPGNPEIFITY